MAREDGRANDQLRPVTITRGFIKYAEGSCLIEMGDTKVICTASVEEKVPPFLKGSGSGWVTSEYGMIPRACLTRNIREASRGQLGGRTMEIQRLIGRSLRSIFDMKAIGERTIWIDCDVIQADGGTRTAAMTGGFVALAECAAKLRRENIAKSDPITDFLAAVSVGFVSGEELLDLVYTEDSTAAVDMNVAMTGSGKFVEIQSTAEGLPFTRERFNKLLDLAQKGITELFAAQKAALAGII